MLAFGLKAHLGRAMLFGNYRADQWILGVMSSSKELGLYSVAVAWSEVLFFLPTTLVAVQRPDLVRASPEEARERATWSCAARWRSPSPAPSGSWSSPRSSAPRSSARASRGRLRCCGVLALGSFGIATLKLLGNALTAQRRPLLETAGVAVAFVTVFALDFAPRSPPTAVSGPRLPQRCPTRSAGWRWP